MAQNNQITGHDRNASSRYTLIQSKRLKNEDPIGARSIVSMKEKMQAQPKQKSGTQLIDSVYMWYWDTTSIDWALDYKYSVEQIDANNNPLAELGQIWDGSAWVYADQVFYTYDVKNNLLNEVWQIWNETVWENNQRGSYEYDANNNLLIELVEYGDGNTWVNSMLIKKTYDANSNQTSYLHQNWNGTDWENHWQETFTYDAKNNITSATNQDWIGNQWVDYSQDTYVYDNNNNLVSSVNQVDNGAELVTSEIAYFYDVDNKLISDSSYTWGNSWHSIRLGTYTYDTNGNLINWLSQSKNNDVPENVTRTIFTYDVANNETSANRQDWKDNSWVNLDFERHAYNQYNLLTNNAYKYWNSSGTKVMDGDSSTYYYHDAITGINDNGGIKEFISIYPNPNAGKFTVTSNSMIQSVLIYNISGKLIYSDSEFIHQMQKEINLSNCEKGVYLIKIKTSKGVVTKQLLIQ